MKPVYSICIRFYVLGWMASPHNFRMFWLGVVGILWSERQHLQLPGLFKREDDNG